MLQRFRHWRRTCAGYGPNFADRLWLWSIYPRAKALNAQYGHAYWRRSAESESERFRAALATPMQRAIRRAHYVDGAVFGYDSKG
jgi:hypothetical protein